MYRLEKIKGRQIFLNMGILQKLILQSLKNKLYSHTTNSIIINFTMTKPTTSIDEMIMNSEKMRETFPHLYKKFFNTHDLVLSGNAILTWGADISHGSSVLRIKQKLPLKIYIGANFNTSGKVTFGKISQYSNVDNSFKEHNLNTFFKHQCEDII